MPTISLLLDLPIPFSNIGVLIDSIITPSSRMIAINSNLEQMLRYARTMLATNDFPELSWLLRYFDHDNNATNYMEVMRHIQHAFRVSWSQFNYTLICIGMLSLVDAVLTVFDLTFETRSDHLIS